MNVRNMITVAEAECREAFARLDEIEYENAKKMLAAFREFEVAERHFAPTTGYGYSDIGRETLDMLFAKVMNAERALVRPQIASGTHALALCLYGLLRPGDKLIAGAGKPYDTLEEVIGISGAPGNGSLRDFGIKYAQVELIEGKIDVAGIIDAIGEDGRLVLLQRSRGYAWRRALTAEEITEAARAIHKAKPGAWVMVDNCYGEFTGLREPEADILAGSLIKNPGGGLAPTGGYIAGRADLVEKISFRLTSPGVGAEVGSYAGGYQPFYQGLFMAPHAVNQALRVATLAARVMEEMGYEVEPRFSATRGDIIQAIKFCSADKLIEFCRQIQFNSPVDSFAAPEPWDMPGYQHKVIMAAGTFVAGASIELSADAPIKEPYIGYLQGGLTYSHGRAAIENAASALLGE